MQDLSNVIAGHDSTISCMAFDFYGNMLATCSTDNSVKIWLQF